MNHEHAITATSPYAFSAHAHAPANGPFTSAELDSLHRQDIAAGRAVVVLMCSIFMLGVFIYTIVAFTIAF